MSNKNDLESRVLLLESELAELKRQLGTAGNARGVFGRVVGSFRDEPEFDEVLRLGREARQADRVEPEV